MASLSLRVSAVSSDQFNVWPTVNSLCWPALATRRPVPDTRANVAGAGGLGLAIGLRWRRRPESDLGGGVRSAAGLGAKRGDPWGRSTSSVSPGRIAFGAVGEVRKIVALQLRLTSPDQEPLPWHTPTSVAPDRQASRFALLGRAPAVVVRARISSFGVVGVTAELPTMAEGISVGAQTLGVVAT
jgi:hypothetical protein